MYLLLYIYVCMYDIVYSNTPQVPRRGSAAPSICPLVTSSLSRVVRNYSSRI